MADEIKTETTAATATATPESKVDASALQKELDTVKAERTALAEYQKAAQTLMGTAGTVEERAAASAHILKAQGYSDAQIDEYLAKEYGGDDPSDEPAGRGGHEDPSKAKIAELEARLDATQKDVIKAKAEKLTERMSTNIQSTVDGSAEYATLFDDLKVLHGGDAKALELAKERVNTRIKEASEKLLKTRFERAKALGGRFQPEWIGEVVPEASVKVLKEIRSEIGANVSKLGRAPETDSGEEVRQVKAVAPPKHEKGKSANDVTAEADAWMTNVLTGLVKGTGKTHSLA